MANGQVQRADELDDQWQRAFDGCAEVPQDLLWEKRRHRAGDEHHDRACDHHEARVHSA
jgi:hypothetical protein